MPRPGPRNLITDVEGLTVGHATDESVQSGVTALLCPTGWAAGVDVRGGGPGVRETEALAPENLVGRAHAILLAGGSVFGLGAADGAAALLSQRGIGLRLSANGLAIPIVPAAVLHDLGNGGDKAWGLDPPYRRLGQEAVEGAGPDFAQGSVGAGRGARAGLVPGGIGSTSIDLGDGLIVGALVAANPVGTVTMADGETFWAWPFEIDGEFGGKRPGPAATAAIPNDGRLGTLTGRVVGANTTLGIVAVSAQLAAAECKRVAMMAQDGLARAIRPAHTPFDGDTVFALAEGRALPGDSGDRALHVARIGATAADCLARAIAKAVYHAATDAAARSSRV